MSTENKSQARIGFLLGRRHMETISAVEGIVTSGATTRMFREFDNRELKPEERRKAILTKHTGRV
jgi:hypothetical protein